MDQLYQSREDSNVSLREVVNVLFEYSGRMLTVFFATMIFTLFLVLFLLSPKFESKATLILSTTDVTRPLANAPPKSDFEKITDFHTQKDVLQSVRLAQEVSTELNLQEIRQIGNIEKLKIQLSRMKNWLGALLGFEEWTVPWDPEAAAVYAITKNVTIETAPQSKAIKLSYRSHSPDESANILATLIEKYKVYYYQQSTAEANGILTYLEERISSAEVELLEAEQAILEFKTEINSQSAQLEDGSKYSTVNITDSLEVQDELKLYILQMEEELRRTSQDLPADDPRIVTLRNKLQSFVKAINDLPQDELKLQQLKRHHTLAQEKYLLLARNLEQAELIAMGNANNLGLISILERPEPDENPVSPKRKLILVLALFMATGLSLAWAYVSRFLDSTIRSPEEFKAHRDLRYLGSLKQIS